MTNRERLLSHAVDCLTAAIELDDDRGLRAARERILVVVLGRPRRWWEFWRWAR